MSPRSFISESQPWMLDAQCVGAPSEAFFPEGDGHKNVPSYEYDMAREYCKRCIVKGDCLDFAIKTKEKYGMWGGLTYPQRQKVARARKSFLAL